MTFNLSIEQQNIIDEIKRGCNIFVNAVAGSGKTTTIVQLAKQYNGSILQITYNAALKLEVRKKVKQEHISNLEIHSYHSFGVCYYDRKAYTDIPLSKVVYENRQPINVFQYDIIVVDEAQDMTMMLFHFIKKIVNDNIKPVQLVFMGDVKQAIYEFKGSDHRFLSKCSLIFDHTFIELPLSRSYRLTDSISSFVNNEMLGKDIIHTEKPGAPVKYYIGDTFNSKPIVILIKEYLRRGYTYDDFFILAPKVKLSNTGNNSPLTNLENVLVENGIQCFVPSDSDNKLNEDVICGKIVFCTFHQSKGRERPIVFVFSFDESWYTYYGKGKDTHVCPNELYVAATRASHELIIVHHYTNNLLPFLHSNMYEIKNKPYIMCTGNMIYEDKKNNENNNKEVKSPCSVTDLTAFIKEDALQALQKIVDIIFKPFSKKSIKIEIPSFINTEYGLIEQIADLNGIAIPSMWQTKHQFTNDIKKRILSEMPHPIIEKELSLLPDDIHTPSEYLRLANIFQAHDTKYIFKIAQIKDYIWLEQDMIDKCHTILDHHLVNGPYEFEYSLDFKTEEKINEKNNKYSEFPYYKTDQYHIPITGRIDALNTNEIWELKCVDTFTIEHFLQIIIYGWIWKTFMEKTYGPRKCYLLNMRTNEGYELDMTSYLLKEVVHILIENKYNSSGLIPLSEWKQKCDSYIPIRIKTTHIQTSITQWIGSILTISNDSSPEIKLTEIKTIQTSIKAWLSNTPPK